MNYCDNCGTKLQPGKLHNEWLCPSCKQHHYVNPIPTIDALLFDEYGRILIGRRTTEPDKGRLNLPGGYVDADETLEEAIARELKEELDLDSTDYGSLTYAGSRVINYILDHKKKQLVAAMVVGDIKHRTFQPNEEASEYLWIKPAELDPEEVTNQGEYDHIQKAAKIYQTLKGHKA